MSDVYVCIYASQVAMCIGANKHKKISEAMDLVWQRVAPASFQAALRRNSVKTEDELTEDIIRSRDDLKELVNITLTTPCDSSDQVARQYDEIARELKAVPLPEEERRLVDDVLKRNLYTSYGNLHEHRVLAYIRDTLGIQCREDSTFYKAQQGECSGPWGSFPWYVGGKIDAIDDERTLLIEIKNRVNRLFYRVPFYEQVQVQTYLHLLDLERGVLVECLKTAAPADEGAECAEAGRRLPGDEPAKVDDSAPHAGVAVNVISIRRDRSMWDREIVPKLEGFVDFLARLVHSRDMQDRYLQSRRRSAMITAHVNAYMKFKSPAAWGAQSKTFHSVLAP